MTKKSPVEHFIEQLKFMHPMYSLYLMQRLGADLEVIREQLPQLFEEDKKALDQNLIRVFSPQFYVNYGNMVSEILNESLDTNIEKFVAPTLEENI